MKVICLVAENVKRLSAVEIRPDANLVQITGKNGNGKTSVLDSLWWGLAGASHIQAEPINKDAKRALIRLELGDGTAELIVTRTFSRQRAKKGEDAERITTSLTVESADGAVFRSPQSMLDALLGELSFDPLAFARAPGKVQVDQLRAFVPGVDFDEIERLNTGDYERRRDLNRQAKEKRAQAEGIERITMPKDERTPIDEGELVDELERAHETNRELDEQRRYRDSLLSDAAAAEDEANELEIRIAELKAEADRHRKNAKGMRESHERAKPIPDPIDTSAIRTRLENAREHNLELGKLIAREKLIREADELEQKAEALTDAIERRNTDKASAIAAAELPVPGLSFGAGDVMLDGVPFEQASDAEQLRASVAIAAALNPKLRVIRIRDGSLLDDDGMTLLAELANETDMQVWIERVDSSGKIGFVIQDGELVAQGETA